MKNDTRRKLLFRSKWKKFYKEVFESQKKRIFNALKTLTQIQLLNLKRF